MIENAKIWEIVATIFLKPARAISDPAKLKKLNSQQETSSISLVGVDSVMQMPLKGEFLLNVYDSKGPYVLLQ